MKRLTTLLCLGGLAGCATTSSYPPIPVATEVLRMPDVGETSNTRLGDSLLEYRRASTYPALKIYGFHRYDFCLFSIEVAAQSAPAKFLHPKGGVRYRASIINNTFGNVNSRHPGETWIYQSDQDPTPGYFVKSPNGCGADKSLVQQVEEIQAVDVESPSFKQVV